MRVNWNSHGRLPTVSDTRWFSPGIGLLIACLVSLLMWIMIVGLAFVL
jgi:hypothetical protein